MKRHLPFTLMFLFLLFTAGFARHLTNTSERESVPSHKPLLELPAEFGAWRQIDAQTLDAGRLRELKADEYLSRTYANDRGSIAYLFISWYASQRHRQTIHSPQNCLPGSGWTMSRPNRHLLGEQQEINEYLIGKDDARMLAFYWYQGRGRVVASEYFARLYTIRDAVWRDRTDGALVRVIVPMGKGEHDERWAREAGLDYAQRLLTLLPDFIPN